MLRSIGGQQCPRYCWRKRRGVAVEAEDEAFVAGEAGEGGAGAEGDDVGGVGVGGVVDEFGAGHHLGEGFDGAVDDAALGVADVLGPLGEEFAALEGEDAAVEAVEIDGDDLGIGLTGHELEASAELIDHAVAGDLAFGEEADDLALFERSGDGADGVLGPGGGDRDGADEAHEPFEPPEIVEGVPHDEADGAAAGGADDEGIDVADVIGQKEDAAGSGDALDVDGLYTIEEADGGEHEEAHEVLGQQAHDVDGCGESGDGEDEELGGGVEIEPLHEGDDGDGDEGAEAVHEVHAGMDAGFFLLFSLVLSEGVEGDHEAAACGAGEDDAGVHPAAAEGCEAGPEESGDEAEAAEGDEAELDAVSGDVGGEEAAADDADAEDAGDLGELHGAVSVAGVGVELFRQGDEDEAEGIGDEPEVGDAEGGEADGAAAEDDLEALEVLEGHAFAPVDLGVGGGGLDAEGGDELDDAEDADDDERPESGHPGIVGLFILGAVPDAAGPHAAEDACEHGDLEPAGDLAETAGTGELLHDAHLGRAEDGGLHGEDEEADEGDLKGAGHALHPQGEGEPDEADDLHDLHPDDDVALGEAV